MENERIIQITSGRGPAECCWVVSQVLKILVKEAKDAGITTIILHREKGIENGTLYSASIKFLGEELDEFLNGWTGTIRWIGQSKFRKHHKRKNWYIGVNLLDSLDEHSFDPNDIRFEFTRSGGPGGQHVNKVSTAVRATHIPSGEVVFVSNGRSQLQNKHLALKRLKEQLEKKSLEQTKLQIQEGWQNHNELDRGNPVKTFKGSDFKPSHRRKDYKSGRKREKQRVKREMEG